MHKLDARTQLRLKSIRYACMPVIVATTSGWNPM